MKTDRSQANQYEKLNQKVLRNYQSLRKRSGTFMVVLIVLLLVCGAILTLLFASNRQYTDKKTDYENQIQALQQEREAILSGKKAVASQSFDETLAQNLAGLKDYPKEENNYQVAIKGTDSTLAINKNNIFVSDNAKILDKKTKQIIYERNKQLAASTEGAQLEVVTVPSLPNGESIESYANTVFNQLGIGNKEKDNGVLYLIAVEDRKFRLEVGYGLEGLIPDGAASDIIDNDDVVDAFKAGNYSQGVTQVVEEVFSIMNTKTALVDSQIETLQGAKNSLAFGRWFGIILLAILLVSSLILLINNFRIRGVLKRKHQDYLAQVQRNSTESEVQVAGIKQTDLYALMLSGAILFVTLAGVQRSIAQGKLLKNPNAKRMSFGRVLIGDTLYAGDGHILTTAYLLSVYNSSNWSKSDNNGSGGGGSWGSFGGGSSGGGGASGGW